MTKFASSAAVILTGFLGLTVGAMFYPWENSSEPLSGKVKSDEEVTQEYVSYFCFKATWNATLAMLGSGEIALADACERIESAARSHYPNYLDNIAVTDPAPTVKDRIARNLVGHLNRAATDERMQALHLTHVEKESARPHR